MDKSKAIGVLLILCAGSLWGTTGIYVRLLGDLGVSTIEIILVRAAIPMLIYVAAIAIFDRKLLRIRLRDLWIFIASGACSLTLFGYFYFHTMQIIPLSTAAVLLYTAPIMVMLMSALLFKEALTRQKVLACAMAFLGCFFVAGIIGNAAPVPLGGIALGLVAALFYALYSIFGRFALNRHYHPLTVTVYSFIFATVAAMPFVDYGSFFALVQSTPRVPLLLLTVAIFSSALPLLCYTLGLARVETGQASIMASIEPVVATVISAVVFKEALGLWGLLGIAMVLGAIVVLNLPARTQHSRIYASHS